MISYFTQKENWYPKIVKGNRLAKYYPNKLKCSYRVDRETKIDYSPLPFVAEILKDTIEQADDALGIKESIYLFKKLGLTQDYPNKNIYREELLCPLIPKLTLVLADCDTDTEDQIISFLLALCLNIPKGIFLASFIPVTEKYALAKQLIELLKNVIPKFYDYLIGVQAISLLYLVKDLCRDPEFLYAFWEESLMSKLLKKISLENKTYKQKCFSLLVLDILLIFSENMSEDYFEDIKKVFMKYIVKSSRVLSNNPRLGYNGLLTQSNEEARTKILKIFNHLTAVDDEFVNQILRRFYQFPQDLVELIRGNSEITTKDNSSDDIEKKYNSIDLKLPIPSLNNESEAMEGNKVDSTRLEALKIAMNLTKYKSNFTNLKEDLINANLLEALTYIIGSEANDLKAITYKKYAFDLLAKFNSENYCIINRIESSDVMKYLCFSLESTADEVILEKAIQFVKTVFKHYQPSVINHLLENDILVRLINIERSKQVGKIARANAMHALMLLFENAQNSSEEYSPIYFEYALLEEDEQQRLYSILKQAENFDLKLLH